MKLCKIYNRIRYCIILIFLCIFIVNNAFSFNAAFKSHKLSNGLELITYKNSKVPLVSICIAIKGGSITENLENNGLTHLWEHMFFKGNALYPTQNDFLKYMRKIGAFWNGTTSVEKVDYFITIPSSFLEEGLKIMSYAISTPLLDEKELVKERKVVEEEYHISYSKPKNLAYELSIVLIYENLHYLVDPLGKREVILNATTQQLLDIKHKIMVPKNSALIITGDFDEGTILNVVEKYFNKWANPTNWTTPKLYEISGFSKTQKIIMVHDDFKTSEILLFFKGPSVKFNTNDTYIADVLMTMLNSKISKIYKHFIESSLVQYINVSYYTQSYSPLLLVNIGANANQITYIEKHIFKEIQNFMNTDYFSLKELDIAKNKIILNYKLDYDKPSQLFHKLGFWWAIAGIDYYQNYLDNIKNVSLDDVRMFVKKYFINQNYVLLKLIPSAEAKKFGFKDNSKPIIDKYKLGY